MRLVITQIFSHLERRKRAIEISLGWSRAKPRGAERNPRYPTNLRTKRAQRATEIRACCLASAAGFACLIIESDGFLGLRGASRGFAVLHHRLYSAACFAG